MPLSRYQIKNEYSLADPELYRDADKDDPEALLEGVAMAGLVGVLRQLGDLAEFAAEIFHDLHEEVMATAARGHGLMVRVQQLEAEFPSIERAFLSQTNHSSFFGNSGTDWHPNLRMDQNLITQGDLPRFVMDSYEECRGPPRLFLLDKFDVAGAGACLKRYTDPSFFKVDGLENPEIHREKKTRKAKKKGSCWRNGETPQAQPKLHTRCRLHQLLHEESIGNRTNDPARHVKLKRRLNEFPFNSKAGESYMEKFLRINSTELDVFRDISVSSPLLLPSNGACELGIEEYDIDAVSPGAELLQIRRHSSSSDLDDTLAKPSIDQLTEEANYGPLGVPKMDSSSEAYRIVSPLPDKVDEKEIAVDGKGKTEGSLDGYQSEDIVSDVDNYMDALATMDTDIETDTEFRAKNNKHFVNVKNQQADANANKQQEMQAQPSDSQLVGNFNVTDDGNSFSNGEISKLLQSDSLSSSMKSVPSDGGISAEAIQSTDFGEAEDVDRSPEQPDIDEKSTSQPPEHVCNDVRIMEAETPIYRFELGEQQSSSSSLTDSLPVLLFLDLGGSLRGGASEQSEMDEECSVNNGLCVGDAGAERNRKYLPDDLLCPSNISGVPSHTGDDFLPALSSESHPDYEDQAVLSDTSPHRSNILQSENRKGEIFTDNAIKEEHAEDLVGGLIDSVHLIVSLTEEQLHGLAVPEIEASVISKGAGLMDAIKAEHDTGVIYLVDSHVDSLHSVASSTEEQPQLPVSHTEEQPQLVVSHAEEQPQLVVSHAEEQSQLGVSHAEEQPQSVVSHTDEQSQSVVSQAEEQLRWVFSHAEEHPQVVVSHAEEQPQLVVSHTEEQHQALALSELEASAPVLTPGGVVLRVHDAITPPVEMVINATSTPVIHCPTNDSMEQQFLEMTEDVSPLELDLAGMHDLDGDVSEADREENNGVSADLDMGGTDALQVEFHSDVLHLPDFPHVSEAYVPFCAVATEAEQSKALTAISTASDADDVSRSGDERVSMDMVKESRSVVGTLHPDGLEIKEEHSPGPFEEAIAEDGNQQAASVIGLETVWCNTDSNLDSSSGLLNDVPNYYITTSERTNMELLSDQNKQDSGSQSPCPVSILENSKDYEHSPTRYNSELDTPLKHKVELAADQFDPESQPAEKASPGSFLQIEQSRPPGCLYLEEHSRALTKLAKAQLPSQSPMSEFKQSDIIGNAESQHVGQAIPESYLQVEPLEFPNDLDQEDLSSTSRLCVVPLASGPSLFEFLPLSNVSEEARVLSNSIFPSFDLLPGVSQNILDEMPPLPPLPPVQWRIGKVHHASQAPERDEGQSNVDSFTQILPSTANNKAQLGHPAIEGEITRPPNPFITFSAIKKEIPQHDYERSAKFERRSTLSLQVPTVVDHGNGGDVPISDGSQSINPLLVPLVTNDERSQHDFLAFEGGAAQPSLHPVSPVTEEDTISTSASRTLQEKPIQPLDELVPETSPKDEKCQGTTVILEGQEVYHQDRVLASTEMNDEKLQPVSSTSEEHSSCSSDMFALFPPLADGKSNGGLQKKLPRPRNPLIDAVVAHDKSKLRKTTERIRPQIGEKLDERDSFLEQIRTKSFNLKPTAVTRPSIQGPKTNLRVAAILEKANSIRQALAGSDEDDDEDSWSDS